MLNKKKVFIGIAPIAWTNDDMPELGAENSFQQCLSEMALAKYKGCEIGSKYPSKLKDLKKALKLRKLRIANCWFSTFLLTEDYAKVEKEFLKKCKFLKSLGAKVIGVSEQSYSIQGKPLPVFDAKYVMNDAEWTRLCDGLNKLGAAAKNIGMTMTFHHHMGTVVQTEKEIDRMLASTDSEKVFLLFDSGHLAYCGENYLSVLKKHVNRIKHVHLKDIRPDVVAIVKKDKLSFLDGVRKGAFTVPGDGSIDFAPIIDILDTNGYEGWLLVEAEQDPAVANPLEYALKARKYIKKLTKI
ncbi:MAG: myo-inosose-2 dehydratase [Clostridia bacterium]|nr:myo-inosose-2 dehydratase [Clostridia bacterium]